MNYTLKKLRTFNAVVVEFASFFFVMNCLIKPSANRKTGNVIQTFFIDKERLESEPSIFGSKCHNCSAVKYCYVGRDKMSVRKALVRLIGGEKTSYKFVTFEQALTCLRESRKMIRLGSYGDPSIMDFELLKQIAETAGYLCYSHFWQDENVDPRLKKIAMASTANMLEDLEAKARGWRTFRVRLTKDAPILPSAIQCPHQSKQVECRDCRLCNGILLDDKRKGVSDVWVYGHGSSHKKIYGEIK